ncbi:hypothetical protein NE237_003819 [Protea cynaroides]|uniref:Uncharacterized protein n=1 Tax=Protea cynaroides TaxID=273540 RepID=A0A9Q0QSS9_9MAGN|nr:hypothetical protein NE237_003819 [Protea cynaroides]
MVQSYSSVSDFEKAKRFKEIVKKTFAVAGVSNVGDFFLVLRWVGGFKGFEKKLSFMSTCDMHEKRPDEQKPSDAVFDFTLDDARDDDSNEMMSNPHHTQGSVPSSASNSNVNFPSAATKGSKQKSMRLKRNALAAFISTTSTALVLTSNAKKLQSSSPPLIVNPVVDGFRLVF